MKIRNCYYALTFLCLLLIVLIYKFQVLELVSKFLTIGVTDPSRIINDGTYELLCDRSSRNLSRLCLCYADFAGSNIVDPESVKCAVTFESCCRLGNVMGQYIGLLVLSRFNRRPPFMTPEMGRILGKYFHLSIPVLSQEVYARNQWTEVEVQYVMKDSYKNISSGLLLKLSGYPFSKTYFQNFVDDIRKEFVLKTEYVMAAQNTLHRIKNARMLSPIKTHLNSSNSNTKISNSTKTSSNSLESNSGILNADDFRSSHTNSSVTFVGVHVRRGDYLKIFNSDHRGVLADRMYFMRAMNYFRERYLEPVFVIVSNDMQWCEENIPNESNDVYFAGTGIETDPITDFALLVNCNHTIYTFGSFGLYAALFTGGEVVYFTNYTDNLFQDAFFLYDSPLPQWHAIAADNNNSRNKNYSYRLLIFCLCASIYVYIGSYISHLHVILLNFI